MNRLNGNNNYCVHLQTAKCVSDLHESELDKVREDLTLKHTQAAELEKFLDGMSYCLLLSCQNPVKVWSQNS